MEEFILQNPDAYQEVLNTAPLFAFNLQAHLYGDRPHASSTPTPHTFHQSSVHGPPPLFAPQDDTTAYYYAFADPTPHLHGNMESEEYDSDDSAFDVPDTIAPARLELQGDEVEEDPRDYELAYGVLEFPDTNYFIKEPSLVLGRDTKLQRWLDSKKLSQRGLDRASRRHLQQLDTANFDRDPERTPPSSHTSEEEIPHVSGGLAVGNLTEIDNTTRLPSGVAFLPIHCPMREDDGDIPNLNAISKVHVQLEMDEVYGWHLTVLGRNGVLLNDDYYDRESKILLQDGDKIQISDLVLYFRCPDMVGYDEDEMYDEVLESDDEEVMAQTNGKKRKRTTADPDDAEPPTPKKPLKIKLSLKKTDDPSSVTKSVETPSQSQPPLQTSQPSATPQVEPKETSVSASVAPEEAEKKKSRSKYPDDPSELLRTGEIVPQKRGPGRPPKNGIMSKREMKERLKAKEEETRRELGEEAAKQLSARFGKGDGDDKKKKQRRRSNDDDDKKKDDGPREPSPKMEDYTPQQLEKPTNTYAELLYPLLQETGPLSLQEIYRHFEKRWPYYKFGCKGTGWQSSIRHTVNTNVEKGEGHFVKDAKDGKGFKWAANPNNPVTQKPARVSNPTPTQPPTYQGSSSNSGVYGQQPYSAAHPTPANMQYQQRPYYPHAANGQQPYQQSTQYRPPQAGTQQSQQTGTQPATTIRQPSHPGAPGAPQGYHPPPPYQQSRPTIPAQANGSGAHGIGVNSGQATANKGQPQAQATPLNTYRPPTSAQGQASGQHSYQTNAHQSAPGAVRPAAAGPPPPPPPNPYSQAPRPAHSGVPATASGPVTSSSQPPQVNAQRPPSAVNASAPGAYQQSAAQRPTATPIPQAAAQQTASPATPTGVPPRPQSAQQMPPVDQWSGLELLMRGRYPAVFDQFKVAFVDAENEGDEAASDAQKQENRRRRARVFAKMVHWFTSHKTIEKEPPANDDDLRNIYDVVKQLLISEHKATLKKRSSTVARAGDSRSTTPAAASPAPGSTVPVNGHVPTSQPPAAPAASGSAGSLATSHRVAGPLLNRPLHTASPVAGAPQQFSRPPGSATTVPQAGSQSGPQQAAARPAPQAQPAQNVPTKPADGALTGASNKAVGSSGQVPAGPPAPAPAAPPAQG